MSTREANLALISTIPEECQEEIRAYLLMNFCTNNPYKPLSANEILSELAQARVTGMVREKISILQQMKSVQSMAYKVIIMPTAKRRLDMYVYYTIETLGNRQAAKAILTDAKATKKKLSMVADSLELMTGRSLQMACFMNCRIMKMFLQMNLNYYKTRTNICFLVTKRVTKNHRALTPVIFAYHNKILFVPEVPRDLIVMC